MREEQSKEIRLGHVGAVLGEGLGRICQQRLMLAQVLQYRSQMVHSPEAHLGVVLGQFQQRHFGAVRSGQAQNQGGELTQIQAAGRGRSSSKMLAMPHATCSLSRAAT